MKQASVLTQNFYFDAKSFAVFIKLFQIQIKTIRRNEILLICLMKGFAEWRKEFANCFKTYRNLVKMVRKTKKNLRAHARNSEPFFNR